MDVGLLTPWAAALALLVALPLAALVRSQRRVEAAQAALGLPGARRPRAVAASFVAVAALAGAAAAQPVVERGAVERARPSVEVFVVLDTSRSMLAAASPTAPTRFDRAHAAALSLRDELDAPVGIASWTDRVLPHLFPTSDREAYRATLERALGIDRPPPSVRHVTATTLEALGTLGTRNFYDAATQTRIALVLGDFETAPFAPETVGTALREARVQPFLVRFGDETERIFAEPADARYAPDPDAPEHAARAARAAGGRSFAEVELATALAGVRAAVDGAERVERVEEQETLVLAPWLALAALVPLAYVVRRRNRA